MFKKLGMVLLGVTLLFGITACTEAPQVEVEAAGTYVAIDINPSIEFIVDEDDNVESFNLINEDAEVICAGVDFIGMNIEEAAALYLELAAEGGFLDVTSDDNAVLITVLGDDATELEEELTEQLKVRVRNRVMRFMAMNYINGEVLTEDFTQEDLVAQADELGVSPGKLKLVLLAQTIDEELVLEEALEMAVKDLLAIVREHHKEVMSEMTDEELALRQEQKEALAEQFKQKLIDHVSSNPNLTEEQIETRVNAIKEQKTTETRTTWEERLEEWKKRVEQRKKDTGNEDSGNTDTGSESQGK